MNITGACADGGLGDQGPAQRPITRAATGSNTELIGAYGLRLRGVSDARALLVSARPEWPAVRLIRRRGFAAAGGEHISDDGAKLALANGGEIVMDRDAERAVFRVPNGLGPQDLVHPYLAPVAAVMAHWFGRESFHAGAFAVDGGAWALLGEREAGKSSTLGWLSQAGYDIVTDDLLVVQETVAFAGPRSIDLREDAAERLAAGKALGVVGARDRWRLSVPTIPSSCALRGWVTLRFGERVEVVKLSAGERVRLLAAHYALRIAPRNPAAVLELASLPGWELSRPRCWNSLAIAMEHLLDAIAG